MTNQQTGQRQIQSYWQVLLPQLQRAAVRSDLGTAETEELIQWASTVTETPLQSISELRQKLMHGLKDFDLIMNDEVVQDNVLVALLQARQNVRYAAIIRKPGKPTKVIAYLGR